MSHFTQLVDEPPLRCRVITMIDCGEWDTFITAVYGRRYDYQQQDGCRGRGTVEFDASPDTNVSLWDYADATPDEFNYRTMGVSLKSWLAAAPNAPVDWHCNFYPSLDVLAKDLCQRGLLPPGRYGMDIDW